MSSIIKLSIITSSLAISITSLTLSNIAYKNMERVIGKGDYIPVNFKLDDLEEEDLIGGMTYEIRDKEGNKIQSITTGKYGGTNKVVTYDKKGNSTKLKYEEENK